MNNIAYLSPIVSFMSLTNEHLAISHAVVEGREGRERGGAVCEPEVSKTGSK